jgi:hypothetical protein
MAITALASQSGVSLMSRKPATGSPRIAAAA